MNINLDTLEGIRGLIIFNISGLEFCADIQNIVAIVKPEESRQLFSENKFKAIEFKGMRFNFVDLRNKMFGFKQKDSKNENRIILMEMFGKLFGFFVRNVVDLLTTDRIFIEKSLDLIPVSDKRYIRSLLKYQGRTIHLPDYELLAKEVEINENVKSGII